MRGRRTILGAIASVTLAAGLALAGARGALADDAIGEQVRTAYEAALALQEGDGFAVNYTPQSFHYGVYCGGGVPELTALPESRSRIGAAAAGVGRRIGGVLNRGRDDEATDAADDAPEDDGTHADVRMTRLGELRNYWPASDQLDALCFAHDYCFDVIGHDSVECDYALTVALKEMVGRFDAAGNHACGNAAAMMYLAFLNKPWSDSDFGRLIRLAEIAALYDGSTTQVRDLLSSRLAHADAGVPRQPGSCGPRPSSTEVDAVLNGFTSNVDYATEALLGDLRNADLLSLISQHAGGSSGQAATLAQSVPGLSTQLDEIVTQMIGVASPLTICDDPIPGAVCRPSDTEMIDAYSGRRKLLVTLVRVAGLMQGGDSLMPGGGTNPVGGIGNRAGGLLRGALGGGN